MRGSIGRTAGASYKRRNKPPSLIRREFEAAASGGGGAVVAARSKFNAAIRDPEIEPMDETAIATLLTKVTHARPRPFAIRNDAIDDALAHGASAASRLRNHPMRETGEKSHQARQRDDRPAHAARVQQSGSLASGSAQVFGS